MSTHLSPEQRDEVLLGTAAAAAVAHLGECPQCQAEVEALGQALGDFRAAAVGWSQRAALRSWPPPPPRRHFAWRWPVWALAAALLVAVALPWMLRHGSPAPSGAPAAAQAQLARDNQLLARIASEVAANTPVPLQPLQNVK